jgi:hypothetical protein
LPRAAQQRPQKRGQKGEVMRFAEELGDVGGERPEHPLPLFLLRRMLEQPAVVGEARQA